MNTPPVESLEMQALEQRNRLHHSAAELRSKVAATREQLDPARNARQHFMGAALVASAIALASGYAAAGIFTSH